MLPQTRAIVAAAAYSLMSGKKVAGVHDHASGKDLLIAAEARGARVQVFDGDRSATFGGTLPELYDGEGQAFVALNLDGTTAQGYDRTSSTHFSLTRTDSIVQLYDHGLEVWFAFTIQVA